MERAHRSLWRVSPVVTRHLKCSSEAGGERNLTRLPASAGALWADPNEGVHFRTCLHGEHYSVWFRDEAMKA